MNDEPKQKSAGKRLEQIVGVFWGVRNQWLSILVVILLLFLLWMTLETRKAGNLGFGDKTYWDWMELLIIPIVLAIGAWWLNKSERENEREIAERNREEDRAIADDRRYQATLEAYFDRMTELLLKEGLRESKEGDEVRSIARTRTLAVLRSLDERRKVQVIQFLYEAHLITSRNTVIELSEANLSDVFLERVNLNEANLSGAYLEGAILNRTNLSGAYLSNTRLEGACLSEANLSRATLRWADLSRTGLDRANLSEADLTGANLTQVNLTGAKVTDEQLVQAKSLAGATLPDGTKVPDEETGEEQG